MPSYVYIIQSAADGSYYKGYSEDPGLRLFRHNNGETVSTRHLRPWKLVYAELCSSKIEALKRERNLKKATRQRLEALIASSKNILDQLI